MSRKRGSILIVDDEEPICNLLATRLNENHECSTAASAHEAIGILESAPFNLVLSDITMPGTSGLELCAIVRERFPETVVVMVSGLDDIRFAIEAMRQGAYDYLIKPFDLSHVTVVVNRALEYQELLAFKRHHEQWLEETVRLRTSELCSLNQQLNHMLELIYINYRATLRSLAKALEARDAETRGHSDRVVAYCLRIGKELGLSQKALIGLEQGALLHDIGKIGVRDSILLKPGPLTFEEWTEMREHVNHGMRIIEGIDLLTSAGAIVGQHHEKYDGTGYPAGLRQEAIHIYARIFAVADAYDAIRSDRPYRAAQSHDVACLELLSGSGKHFDPDVIEAFLNIAQTELEDIRSLAERQDYTLKIIDEKEIHAFIISVKAPVNLKGHREFQASGDLLNSSAGRA